MRMRSCLPWRKGRRCLVLGILLSLILGGWYLCHVISDILEDMKCSEEESHVVLKDYCDMYREGRVVGDLCPGLCEERRIKYKHCTNYKHGKRVFIVDCHDICDEARPVKAVLKTRHRNFSEFLTQEYSFENEDNSVDGPTLEVLRLAITDILKDELGMTIPEDADPISLVWEDKYMKYYHEDDKHSQFAVGRSVIALLRQPEYLLMKVNQDKSYFPKIYGTCGPLYLVEHAPPGDMLEQEIKFTENPWLERAKIARGILEIVRSLDERVEESLHLCDVKGENFGISESGQIKLIDTDTVFFDKRMLKELGHDNCTKNIDCDFFDCGGWCNSKTGHCESVRINNNLQSVCQDVFLGHLMDTFGGLLRNPPRPIRAELKTILEKCAYGGMLTDGIPIQKPTDDIYWRLYNILKNSIDGHS